MNNQELKTLNKSDTIISLRTKNTATFLDIRSGNVRIEFEGKILPYPINQFLETFAIHSRAKNCDNVNKSFTQENTTYYDKRGKLIKIKTIVKGRFTAWFTDHTFDKNGISDSQPIFNLDRLA
jgi:hypothetical protein